MSDVKIGYQVVLYDEDGDVFRPANGSGQTAKVFATVWEAQDNIKSWGLMFRPAGNYYLGIQEVRKKLLPDTLRPTAEVRAELMEEHRVFLEEREREAAETIRKHAEKDPS